MERTHVVLLICAIALAGCLNGPKDVGCCSYANATQVISPGCMLYYESNDTLVDMMSNTLSCNVTGLYCNVSITPTSTYLVPICPDTSLLACRAPDCQAMVCGDFKFSPPIPAAIAGTDTNPTLSAPADTNQIAALNFYKAQCRFITMDKNLRTIMQNSNSNLDVFRFGVGGSFDEYDQYKNFFPMSDKFCAANPTTGQILVDRYMNYLNPKTLTQYDPLAGITANNANDTTILPPYSNDESGYTGGNGTLEQYGNVVKYNYNPVIPDKSNYQMAYYGRLDYPMSITNETVTGNLNLLFGFSIPVGSAGPQQYLYNLGSPYVSQDSVYKELDQAFYKKWLSIVYSDYIYGGNLHNTNTTRAPFECDVSANECYSGVCSTSVYNRVVMLDNNSNEVVTDCESYTDEFQQTKIICAPTMGAPVTSTTSPPTRNFAQVDASTLHVEGPLYPNEPDSSNCGIFNKDQLKNFKSMYTGNGYSWSFSDGYGYSCGNMFSSEYFNTSTQVQSDVGMITNTATGNLYGWNGTNWVSTFSEASQGPPAGGALFYGYTPSPSTYGNDNGKVIGFAIASKNDISKMDIVSNCGMVENKDYYVVQVPSNPKQWNSLAQTFYPYWSYRFSGMSAISPDDPCGALQCQLASDQPNLACSYFYDFLWPGLPWVINFDKQGLSDTSYYLGPGNQQFFLSSEIAMGLFKTNRFNESYVQTSQATSCALRNLNAGWQANGNGLYWLMTGNSHDSDVYWAEGSQPDYDMLYSKYIAIFVDKGDHQLGNCQIDQSTGMPKVKTFGWCEPCTTSTLAYQSLTASSLYAPGGYTRLDLGGVQSLDNNNAMICSVNGPSVQCSGFSCGQNNSLICTNDHITDISDYNTNPNYPSASPRTIPEASVIKERLGNFMKSGIMPVLDLSDASNWDPNYPSYDFKNLFGNMGAEIVIVDTVDNASDATNKAQDIANRAATIRENCFGCLTAFQVNDPQTSIDLDNAAADVFSNELSTKFSIDMVTYSYPISDHDKSYPSKDSAILAADPSANVSVNNSQMVADDITSYSETLLKDENKPSLLVGLNLDSADSVFKSSDYQTLFDTIFANQETFIKSGLVGIIYAPARQIRFPLFHYVGPQIGIVDTDNNNVGTKNAKFAALQDAASKMTLSPPISVFTLTEGANQTLCEQCTSLEQATGNCGPDALMCDDNVSCTPPNGMSLSSVQGTYKCPDTTIVDDVPDNQRCQLCNETAGTAVCSYDYANGTIEQKNYSMSAINNDGYLDVMAGIPRPQKCCLENPDGSRYTYEKKTSNTPFNKPIAFSKTGDPNIDCGLNVDIGAIQQAQTFCGVQIPLKDYDINCVIK